MNGLTICKTDKPFTCGGVQSMRDVRTFNNEYYEVRVDVVEQEEQYGCFVRTYLGYILEKPQKALELWENEGGLVR